MLELLWKAQLRRCQSNKDLPSSKGGVQREVATREGRCGEAWRGTLPGRADADSEPARRGLGPAPAQEICPRSGAAVHMSADRGEPRPFSGNWHARGRTETPLLCVNGFLRPFPAWCLLVAAFPPENRFGLPSGSDRRNAAESPLRIPRAFFDAPLSRLPGLRCLVRDSAEPCAG